VVTDLKSHDAKGPGGSRHSGMAGTMGERKRPQGGKGNNQTKAQDPPLGTRTGELWEISEKASDRPIEDPKGGTRHRAPITLYRCGWFMGCATKKRNGKKKIYARPWSYITVGGKGGGEAKRAGNKFNLSVGEEGKKKQRWGQKKGGGWENSSATRRKSKQIRSTCPKRKGHNEKSKKRWD